MGSDLFQRVIVGTCVLTVLLTSQLGDAKAEGSDPVPVPKGMAVLGDSLSEALFADFDKENPPSNIELLHMLSLNLRYDRGERAAHFRKNYARPRSSWSGGNDTSDVTLSHYERLKRANPSMRLLRFARSGSHTKDIITQAAAVVTAQRDLNIEIDYVTILIGANDFVKGSPEAVISVEEALLNVRRGMEILLQANPQTKILLVGLPPIQEVFEETRRDKMITIWNYDYKCEEIRQLVYGEAIIFDPSHSQYQNIFNAMALYDERLDDLAAEVQGDYPDAHIRSVRRYRPSQQFIKSLSVDCFHLSHFGHAEVAEITWQKGFWPQLQ